METFHLFIFFPIRQFTQIRSANRGSAILSFHGQSPTEAQSVAGVQTTNCFTSADAAQLEPSSPEPGRWSRYVDLH
jgi:hypothetical protein